MKTLILYSKLVFRGFWRSKTRFVTSILAISIVVCLITWLIRGYTSYIDEIPASAKSQMGRFDAVFASVDGTLPPIHSELIKEIQGSADFNDVVLGARTEIGFWSTGNPEKKLQSTLLAMDSQTDPFEIVEGRWPSSNAEHFEVAISTARAKNTHAFRKADALKVGDELILSGWGTEKKFRIVGIVNRISKLSEQLSIFRNADLFVSRASLNVLENRIVNSNIAYVTLAGGREFSKLKMDWNKKIANYLPAVEIGSAAEIKNTLSSSHQIATIEAQAQYVGAIGMLAALLIVYSVMSAGMHQRMRYYAMLKSILLSGLDLVFLLLFEGISLAICGWLTGILIARILLGLGNSIGGFQFQSKMMLQFTASDSLGSASIVVSGICIISGTVLALVIPAYRLVQLKAADIFSQHTSARPFRLPLVITLIGVLLLFVNPILVVVSGIEVSTRKSLYYGVGVTAMVLGFVMVSPLAIRWIRKLLVPILAKVLNLNRRLVEQQLTVNERGLMLATLSLTLGLGLFILMQVWGHSMLVPFLPDSSLPRYTVAIDPYGLDESLIPVGTNAPEALPNECIPLWVDNVSPTPKTLALPAFKDVLEGFTERREKITLIGLDAKKYLGASDPAINLNIITGDLSTVIEKLDNGNGCLVPNDFAVRTGLTIGDELEVFVPDAKNLTATYVIAGVIDLPGRHWVTSWGDMRRRGGWGEYALFIVGDSSMRRNFKQDHVSFFWLNARPGIEAKQIQSSFQSVANKTIGSSFETPEGGKVVISRQTVKISDREEEKAKLIMFSHDVIWRFTYLPMVALLINSLAVFNSMMATIRARYWEYGILRAIGATRSVVLRIVMCEALVIAGSACVLSTFIGILGGWCAKNAATYVYILDGMTPPLIIPWGNILLGFLLTLIICALAAVVPSIVVSAKPLTLLQRGRMSV